MFYLLDNNKLSDYIYVYTVNACEHAGVHNVYVLVLIVIVILIIHCNIIVCLYYTALCVCVCVIDGLCPISKQKVFVSEVSLVPAGLYMCVYIHVLNVLYMYIIMLYM